MHKFPAIFNITMNSKKPGWLRKAVLYGGAKITCINLSLSGVSFAILKLETI
jgi:hypothetical protein